MATVRNRTRTLTTRALNRALLERQMLLVRKKRTVPQALEHLVGMQAQAPHPPYVGLWTRLDPFRPERLGQLLTDRKVVRIALMRSTIHLVTAEDALELRPVTKPVLERVLGAAPYGPMLRSVDLREMARVARRFVEEEPATLAQLGDRLAQRWPDVSPSALVQAARALVPLVQIPPRGVWGKSGPAAHTSLESWLGRKMDPRPSIQALILRYLRAFGPATVADVQTWSGLTRLREVTDEMVGAEIRSFRDATGKHLLDVPRAPLPDPDTPAPIRFLPEFDNLLLSHADRTRVISEGHRKRVAARNGMVPGALLIDGYFAGTWKLERTAKRAIVVVEPYDRRPTKVDAAEIEAEGLQLVSFVAPERDHDVRIVAPR